jgi:ribosomal protein S28E/S33
MCNFMTTWGDGVFDVYRDTGTSGELVQIRIELQTNLSG